MVINTKNKRTEVSLSLFRGPELHLDPPTLNPHPTQSESLLIPDPLKKANFSRLPSSDPVVVFLYLTDSAECLLRF